MINSIVTALLLLRLLLWLVEDKLHINQTIKIRLREIVIIACTIWLLLIFYGVEWVMIKL